jgi:putative restriction endonuclease
VIYHCPSTARHSGRDAAEVQTTKNSKTHHLPIFVILPGETSRARRHVKLGWVTDFDDESRQFLILFGEKEPSYAPAPLTDQPFVLEEDRKLRSTQAMARVGQQKFRFQVLAQYGPKCAVCDIRHPSWLKAAHMERLIEAVTIGEMESHSAPHTTTPSTRIYSGLTDRAHWRVVLA